MVSIGRVSDHSAMLRKVWPDSGVSLSRGHLSDGLCISQEWTCFGISAVLSHWLGAPVGNKDVNSEDSIWGCLSIKLCKQGI